MYVCITPPSTLRTTTAVSRSTRTYGRRPCRCTCPARVTLHPRRTRPPRNACALRVGELADPCRCPAAVRTAAVKSKRPCNAHCHGAWLSTCPSSCLALGGTKLWTASHRTAPHLAATWRHATPCHRTRTQPPAAPTAHAHKARHVTTARDARDLFGHRHTCHRDTDAQRHMYTAAERPPSMHSRTLNRYKPKTPNVHCRPSCQHARVWHPLAPGPRPGACECRPHAPCSCPHPHATTDGSPTSIIRPARLPATMVTQLFPNAGLAQPPAAAATAGCPCCCPSLLLLSLQPYAAIRCSSCCCCCCSAGPYQRGRCSAPGPVSPILASSARRAACQRASARPSREVSTWAVQQEVDQGQGAVGWAHVQCKDQRAS